LIMAEAVKKQIVTRGPANFVLRGGGFMTVQTGEPVPDDLADGQLEHKRAAGAFDPPLSKDWATLAEVGIGPAPAEAAAQIGAASINPVTALASIPSPGPSGA
jgi:hypothetical protein